MAYSILLGPNSFDAVAYARSMSEDTIAPLVIPDTTYQSYVDVINKDFSRFVPWDQVVGNPVTLTSPLSTVTNQQRYLCNVANGFTLPVMQVTDCLYRATNAFSAASEIAYLALLPFSPLNRFLFTPSLLDSPSERVLRDEYLNELDHYGRGYYRVVRDVTGLVAIELYPIPTVNGTPIYVRYTGTYPITASGGNSVISTIPDDLTGYWADLLFAKIQMEEAERLAKIHRAKAGLIDILADPRAIRDNGLRLREDTYLTLGLAQGVGIVST